MNNNTSISQSNLIDLATKINTLHDAAASSARTTLEHAAECGRLLTRAKELCGHGHFGPWLAANFRGSGRTANHWMKLADGWEVLSPKFATVANLGVKQALDLLTESERWADDRADLYDAVEHPTMTPAQWRNVIKTFRAECPTENFDKAEADGIELAWEELTIGRGLAVKRDDLFTGDSVGFNAELIRLGRAVGIDRHRLRSHVAAWDNYVAGEPDADEPDFDATVRTWAEGGAA